jgi:hypothetical protein
MDSPDFKDNTATFVISYSTPSTIKLLELSSPWDNTKEEVLLTFAEYLVNKPP